MLKEWLVPGLVGALTIACSAEGGSQAGQTGPVFEQDLAGIDCSGVDTYTASLATLTVDCLGTIDQNSFAIDENGFLTRAFSACQRDGTELDSIDGILSLQRRGERLPFAKECIAGRWANWKAKFDRSGITQCPSWHKKEAINAPSLEHIAALSSSALARPEQYLRAETVASPKELRQDNLYAVAFDGASPKQACATPGECAAACAAGFAGFVLETHDQSVLTDPAYWLLDTTYPTAAADPFLCLGYYHPMSYCGPLPGQQFAHRNRYKACPTCPPETCSYYAGSIHIKLPLTLDCLDPADPVTCVAVCAP